MVRPAFFMPPAFSAGGCGGREFEDGAEGGFVRQRERESAGTGNAAVKGWRDQLAGLGLRLVFEAEPVELEVRRQIIRGKGFSGRRIY